MFCKNCGKELPEGTRICDECGTSAGQPTQVKVKNTGKDTACLVLGIIGLFAWFIPIIGYGISIPGLVISIKELNNGNKSTKVVLGLVFCALCLVASLINSILGVMMNAGQL